MAAPVLLANCGVPLAGQNANADLSALERLSGGQIGFYAENLDTGSRIAWRANQRFAMCSTFKASLAAAVLERVDQGREQLERRVFYGPSDLMDYAPVAKAHAPDAKVEALISGEAFLTEPGALSDIVSDAIEARTGARPALSTSGGTSDARFLSRVCPVVEFGLVNATMHKLDEAVAVTDLWALADIYADVLGRALAS